MRVVFFMRHVGYVRNFEWVLEELAGRGHEVTLVVEEARPGSPSTRSAASAADRLAERHDAITLAYDATGRRPVRDFVARQLRLGLASLRYFRPEYADAPKLSARAAARAPLPLRLLLRLPVARRPAALRRIDAVLDVLERRLPLPGQVERLLREAEPDLVLVTPLVEFGGNQSDHVRVAQRLGLSVALMVASWDNLTNKALVRDRLDAVVVWNEAQRSEATELHRVPEERVVVTGAHSYDHWFRWEPSSSREAFCERLGLPAGRPLLLYLCSSPFIAPAEVPFVLDWVARLRGDDDPQLAGAAVLVRPHPQNQRQWREASLPDLEAFAVHPRTGANPVDEEARREYFDAIHHCDAVVGVNTSALIESAIVGRPVHTVLDPRFRETQEGTLHFRHLVQEGGGLLRAAASLDEHAAQLREVLHGAVGTDNEPFLRSFVRPHGLDRPAAPLVVDALERVASGDRAPARDVATAS